MKPDVSLGSFPEHLSFLVTQRSVCSGSFHPACQHEDFFTICRRRDSWRVTCQALLGSDLSLLLIARWPEPVTYDLPLAGKEWEEIQMSKVSKEARVDRGEKEVMEKSRRQQGAPGNGIQEPKEETVTRRRE